MPTEKVQSPGESPEPANVLGRDVAAGRVGTGLLVAVNALFALTQQGESLPIMVDPPVEGSHPLSFATLLDKIGDSVGRACCWLEAKLGLTPKK